MYASALPRRSRSSEICVEINRKPEKHPQRYRSKLEERSADLIIFGRNISDITGY